MTNALSNAALKDSNTLSIRGESYELEVAFSSYREANLSVMENHLGNLVKEEHLVFRKFNELVEAIERLCSWADKNVRPAYQLS